MTKPKANPARTPAALSQIWIQRTELVKQEMAAASAAIDAKTARLKMLRLEKEKREADATPRAEEVPSKSKPLSRTKRFIVS